MKKPLAKGFKCAKCQTEHAFPAYVYAHWDIPLTHTCDCGQEHSLHRGVATPVKKR